MVDRRRQGIERQNVSIAPHTFEVVVQNTPENFTLEEIIRIYCSHEAKAFTLLTFYTPSTKYKDQITMYGLVNMNKESVTSTAMLKILGLLVIHINASRRVPLL